MAEQMIFSGESKNIEYKASVPDRSENYMKTIVAFANTQGGRLLIGIDDKTHQAVGVESADLFQIMDSIANAVSDSCEPQIIPDIEPQTVDGKNIIVVTVAPGKNRPYYLKSKGKEKGTYIRTAGTSRPAYPDKIKELEMEGARISWDELVCVDYPVDEEAVERLCRDIEDFRKKADMPEHTVRKEQLVNWRILKQSGEQFLATNAFALLTSDYFSFSKTQCAVFKGEDRTVFLDKREFTGPIYTQIEEAVEFVLRNIRLGVTINGLVRKEKYELPPESIREMIINAQCHRNFLEDSCIQVAVYDDRLEVTSPGGLYNGLTYEELMSGHSKIRNKGIANIFSQMGLVEAWGSGIKRIFQGAEEYGLPRPKVQEFDNMFRVELYRKSYWIGAEFGHIGGKIGETSENYRTIIGEELGSYQAIVGETSDNYRVNIGKTAEKYQKGIGEKSKQHRRRTETASEKQHRRNSIGETASEKHRSRRRNDTQEKILKLLSGDNRLSAKKLAQQTGVASRNIEENIRKLKQEGILVRHGSPKNGYWEIKPWR